MKGTVIHEVLVEEHKIRGPRSTLALVDDLAELYGLKKISETFTPKKVIKDVIKQESDKTLWLECMKSPLIKARDYFGVRDKSHFKWTKIMAQAFLGWRCGSLKFKTLWRLYNVKRGIGTRCVMEFRGCAQEDTWNHMISCQFYDEKYDPETWNEKDVASYIVRVNRERLIKAKMPLI